MSSFDELKANKDKAKGKIVLFDAPFVSYGETVRDTIMFVVTSLKINTL